MKLTLGGEFDADGKFIGYGCLDDNGKLIKDLDEYFKLHEAE